MNVRSKTKNSSHSSSPDYRRDYRNAWLLGFIIGLALLPILLNLNIGKKYPFLYLLSLLLMPAVAFFGIYLARILVSRIPLLWQFAKFGLIGVSNTVINFGVLNLLSFLTSIYKGQPVYLFGSFAFICALTNSYFWNSHWSFAEMSQKTQREFIYFALITFVGFLINNQVLFFVSTKIDPLWNLSQAVWLNIANLIATFITMIWNFSGFKFVVFSGAPRNTGGQKT